MGLYGEQRDNYLIRHYIISITYIIVLDVCLDFDRDFLAYNSNNLLFLDIVYTFNFP